MRMRPSAEWAIVIEPLDNGDVGVLAARGWRLQVGENRVLRRGRDESRVVGARRHDGPRKCDGKCRESSERAVCRSLH